jgi:hypothetical protein
MLEIHRKMLYYQAVSILDADTENFTYITTTSQNK